ncbi:hypothetical protein G9464_07650 [Halostella sp. JP-L12]|uniref:hypothetical protein n=1 Tax=Halostella TaxID=1843185 RepID=UPI000EF7887F|nr:MULTISPECIES: hypothetical protein [Halostella]NHN47468.1 hypothetical protein [Halostella sp. JP-L12]
MTDADAFGRRRLADELVPDRLTLAVFNSDCSEAVVDALGEELSAFFDVESVTQGETIAGEKREFAVLHDDVLLDGPILHGDATVDDLGGAVSGAQPVDTIFIADYGDRDGLRTLSQRIEKKAWWAGEGELYASGHQRLSAMDDQWELYESIADEGTGVTVFESPEWAPTDHPGVTVREEGGHAMSGVWLVLFDGAGNDAAKGALVAVEREPDTYYGLWSVDPTVVDHLRKTAIEASVTTER